MLTQTGKVQKVLAPLFASTAEHQRKHLLHSNLLVTLTTQMDLLVDNLLKNLKVLRSLKTQT